MLPKPPTKIPVEPPEQKLRPAPHFDLSKAYPNRSIMRKILSFLKDRLKEGSTWVATSILVALGISGEAANETVDLAIQLLAWLLVVLPDKQKAPAPDAPSD